MQGGEDLHEPTIRSRIRLEVLGTFRPVLSYLLGQCRNCRSGEKSVRRTIDSGRLGLGVQEILTEIELCNFPARLNSACSPELEFLRPLVSVINYVEPVPDSAA